MAKRLTVKHPAGGAEPAATRSTWLPAISQKDIPMNEPVVNIWVWPVVILTSENWIAVPVDAANGPNGPVRPTVPPGVDIMPSWNERRIAMLQSKVGAPPTPTYCRLLLAWRFRPAGATATPTTNVVAGVNVVVVVLQRVSKSQTMYKIPLGLTL